MSKLDINVGLWHKIPFLQVTLIMFLLLIGIEDFKPELYRHKFQQ